MLRPKARISGLSLVERSLTNEIEAFLTQFRLVPKRLNRLRERDVADG
jgi:hypothetical protein